MNLVAEPAPPAEPDLFESIHADENESIATDESSWLVIGAEEYADQEVDLLREAESRARELQASDATDEDEEGRVNEESDSDQENEEEHMEWHGVEEEDDSVVEDDGHEEDPPKAAGERTDRAPVADVPPSYATKQAEDVDARRALQKFDRGDAADATFLAAAPLQIHGAGGVFDDCRGDVTKQWVAALQHFPSVSGAFCVGRVAMPHDVRSPSLVLARVVVQNSGHNDWPHETTLRIVAGDGHGFHELPIGGLPAGHAAELVLDLHMCGSGSRDLVGSGVRSGWVLTDGLGRPFGPLLVFEMVWA